MLEAETDGLFVVRKLDERRDVSKPRKLDERRVVPKPRQTPGYNRTNVFLVETTRPKCSTALQQTFCRLRVVNFDLARRPRLTRPQTLRPINPNLHPFRSASPYPNPSLVLIRML